MKMSKVLNNRDPLRMGRVSTEDGWLTPLYRGNSKSGLVFIPAIGSYILVKGKFYIPNEKNY
jgi:hypothetical protein